MLLNAINSMKPDPKFIKKIQAAIRERQQFWIEVEEAIGKATTKHRY